MRTGIAPDSMIEHVDDMGGRLTRRRAEGAPAGVAAHAWVDWCASDCPLRVRSFVEEAMSSNLPPSRRR
jgi:hypothetical protein